MANKEQTQTCSHLHLHSWASLPLKLQKALLKSVEDYKVILVMPLPLGQRHGNVPLKEKLELIPLKTLVLRAGRRIENFLSSCPWPHSSYVPCRACLHGALVPNCPKQRASDYTEHTLPICLLPTPMDHTVISDLAPAHLSLQKMCLR